MLGVKLRRFYGDLRQKSGDEYKRSSLVNVRAGLNRHLISPPYDRKVNLMHDTAFQGANQVFYGLIRTLKQQRLDRTVHKSALTEADFKKLYSCGILDTNNPVTLQNKVFVEVNLHFCRRGREGLRELKKDSFVKKSDSNGRTYITLGFNELEKNHQGFDKRDYQEEPRMYEQEGDQCPVKSFDLYVSKLHPECRAFFSALQKNSMGKKHGLWTVQLVKTCWPRKWRNFPIKLAYRGFTQITVSGHLPSLSWISVEFRRRTFVQCPDTGVLTAFFLTPPVQLTKNGTRWVPSSMTNRMVKSGNVTVSAESSSQLYLKAQRAAVTLYHIHNPSYYHHQIGSIHLSHCCHIFPWLWVWDGCTIIFCHLLHIYPGNTGTLFPLLMFSLWYLQMIGYIMASRSCSFVCRLHHLIIIIMQTYLKALNY